MTLELIAVKVKEKVAEKFDTAKEKHKIIIFRKQILDFYPQTLSDQEETKKNITYYDFRG